MYTFMSENIKFQINRAYKIISITSKVRIVNDIIHIGSIYNIISRNIGGGAHFYIYQDCTASGPIK